MAAAGLSHHPARQESPGAATEEAELGWTGIRIPLRVRGHSQPGQSPHSCRKQLMGFVAHGAEEPEGVPTDWAIMGPGLSPHH